MKKIVILGAGYGGLSFLRNLSKQALMAAEWVLVSEHELHYKTTQLHKLASGEDLHVTKPVAHIIPSNVKFIKSKVSEILPGKLIAECGEITYDELIVAAGASSNPFDITGLENAYEIGDLAHAQETYKQLCALPNGAKIAVLGAGFSGCELAGSLAKTKRFSIDLIEAMPEILPMYPEHLAKLGHSKLANMGVNVLTSHRIRALENGRSLRCTVGEEDKITNYDAVIFTAGVRGSALLESCFIPARGRRVAVDEYLRAPECPGVFVIGDCAAFFGGNERPYAPTAQIACQMGAYLGKCFSQRAAMGALAGEYKPSLPFSFHDKGSVCSLGPCTAIGYVNGRVLKGKIASWLKDIIDAKWDWQIR